MKEARRVFLKLSGEALADKEKGGYNLPVVQDVARQVKEAVDAGVQVGIVIGGGNYWRGLTGTEIDRTQSDQIGMLATVMNCIYVSEVFRYEGMKTEIFTPFQIGAMTKLFSKDAAVAAMKDGAVCFFAGGTGHPFFSTDTGIVLRALEVEADAILLAKAIDGVYDSDPRTNPDAKKFDTISIHEVVDRKLEVIDRTAAVMCEANKMALAVFDLREPDSIRDALNGKIKGTVVTAD